MCVNTCTVVDIHIFQPCNYIIITSPPPPHTTTAASTTWFHVYRLVLTAATTPTTPTTSTQPTPHPETSPTTVATMLEQYMQTAPMGQYHARLQILQGVQGHLQLLQGHPAAPQARVVAAVVHHVVQFYGQFVGVVSGALEGDLKPIRQHVKV